MFPKQCVHNTKDLCVCQNVLFPKMNLIKISKSCRNNWICYKVSQGLIILCFRIRIMGGLSLSWLKFIRNLPGIKALGISLIFAILIIWNIICPWIFTTANRKTIIFWEKNLLRIRNIKTLLLLAKIWINLSIESKLLTHRNKPFSF